MAATRPSPDDTAGLTSPSFREALRFWLKLGCISFGGPAGQIALLHEETVVRRRWISEGHFMAALNVCMALPGPEAQQLATYLGWRLHRLAGGVAAGLLFILPSLLLLIGLSWLYVRFGQLPALAGVLYGVKPALCALVVQATLRIGQKSLTRPLFIALAVLAFVAATAFAVPFPLIVAVAAVTGYAFSPRTRPATPPPPRPSRPLWPRACRTALIGLTLWLVPMVLMGGAFGWNSPLAEMGEFFTKAALLTFGGAYAVLPYVYHGVVTQYGWLSQSEMLDGLALGESTPGPLIMIVTYAGFLAGWHTLPLGHDHALSSAILAALVASWFTFLPSFVMVLGSAPLIEATTAMPGLNAPLAAIRAAITGVILQLAVFFGKQVFWPHGWHAPPDYAALLIGLAAAIALLRYQQKVTRVLPAAALLGLFFTLWH